MGSKLWVSLAILQEILPVIQENLWQEEWLPYGKWIENVLESLLQKYEPWDIYNADETSLFFKLLSDRTMSFDGEQLTGSKLTSSKDHLSLMLCASMTSTDKHKPVLVGKAVNPACLEKKGLSIVSLGVNYYHNAKGRMTGAVFDLQLSEWNRELYKQKRKIALLFNNAPGLIVDDYDNIELGSYPQAQHLNCSLLTRV